MLTYNVYELDPGANWVILTVGSDNSLSALVHPLLRKSGNNEHATLSVQIKNCLQFEAKKQQ